MKTLRTLLTWVLLSAAAHVMGYSLTVSPIEIEAGQTANLIINLDDAPDNFTAYQMTVYLPDGVTVIAEYAFYQCTRLAEVKLPEALITLSASAFRGCGQLGTIALPEGLQESEKLPEPIYTPSTKAEIGDHDENISFEQSIDVLEKAFPGHGQEYAEKIRDCTIALYKKCADYALTRGIIIADTKFEFGIDEEGNLVLGDEMLTPDSSRFWPVEGYEAGHGQPSFDKQYVRDWLKANPESDYNLPEDVIARTIEKYKEAYLLITGSELNA